MSSESQCDHQIKETWSRSGAQGSALNEVYLFSVVVPTYNRAEQLVAAIGSVLNRTYRRLEILVIDDGSTDCTADAVQTIIEHKTTEGSQLPRIRYLYQSNEGPSAARNRGITEAKGEWIAFLNSDDIWLPEKLEWQVRAIQQFENCGACFTDARLVDSQGLATTAYRQAGRHYTELMAVVADPVRTLAKAFGGSWIQTLVARSDLVRQIEGFDPDLHFAEDYDFLFRLALVSDQCYVNQALAVIDRTNAIIDPKTAPRSWDRVEFRLRALQYMYEKWLSLKAEYTDDVRRTILHNLRGVHSGWTNWYLEERQFEQARQAVLTAMKYQITPGLALKCALTWTVPDFARKIARSTSAML